MNNAFIKLFLGIRLLSYVAYGQTIPYHTYRIESLEGKMEKVVVINDLNAYHDRVQIVYRNDTLNIFDNRYGIWQTKLLNKNFLKIEYSSSGGSGLNNAYLLLLCIKDGKLHIPLHIMSVSSFVLGNSEDDYYVKINSRGTLVGGNFRLNAVIGRTHQSEDEPKSHWYDHRKTTVLNFDKEHLIFYNGHRTINKRFTLYIKSDDIGDGKESKVRFKGTFPVIDLDMKQYYFINGKWYEAGIIDCMYEHPWKDHLFLNASG